MPSTVWSKQAAEIYDATSAPMFEPAVVDPAVDFLFEVARRGPVLELAVGTGRIALPLSGRGVAVQGIELSPFMVDELRRKPGADAIAVTIGDMTSTRVAGSFSLVYLVWNAIMNVTTQDEQVAVFENAAAHLAPGGRFVVEVGVPTLQRFVPGDDTYVFTRERGHVGVDTLDDPVAQLASSHHWMNVDGAFVYEAGQYRCVWPSELDLMARIAGLGLEGRWAGWKRQPFSAASPEQVVVYAKPA